jgi:anti-sigma regulatory factor (Ser/Thr protein kinase)
MLMRQISGPVILEVPSDPTCLFMVRCLVERISQRLGFADEEVGGITLAVDEACANVIRHAYGNRPDERIVLTLNIKEDRLEIHIRDFGRPPQPKDLKSRDLKEIRPGGLGIHFIKSAMDEVRYDAPPDGGGLLSLIKYRT